MVRWGYRKMNGLRWMMVIWAGLLYSANTSRAEGTSTGEDHHILYLNDERIVVLKLTILIDGAGPRKLQEEFVDALFKRLDKNSDGILSIDESRGGIPTPREMQQLQIGVASEIGASEISADSNPKDGRITRSELVTYFKRLGLSPISVQFQPKSNQADSNAANMNGAAGDIPLFERLDSNSDAKLSKDELKNAIEVLHKLDRDDDETISAVELQAVSAIVPMARPRSPNTPPSSANPFVSMAGGESIQKLIRRVIDKYDSGVAAKSGVAGTTAKNQKLSRMEVGLNETAFQNLDVDGDSQLDFDELRQFIALPEADFELSMNVSKGMVKADGVRAAEVRMSPDGMAHLQLGNVQLSLSATLDAADLDLTLPVRPLFMLSDSNANGYLEKDEAAAITQLGAVFEDLDGDKNGKLFLDEVVGYLKSRIDAARSRVVVTVVEQGRTLFDILDGDRDRRLSHREIRTAADKIALWDKDKDDYLAQTEIPLQFSIVAARGSVPGLLGVGNPANVMANAEGPAERTLGPVWFRKMDKNRDGEVSRREFLGEIDQFEELDQNRDGAVELSEAVRAQ